MNHVKSGFFFASKRNKIFASISNFASEAKVRAHPRWEAKSERDGWPRLERWETKSKRDGWISLERWVAKVRGMDGLV